MCESARDWRSVRSTVFESESEQRNSPRVGLLLCPRVCVFRSEKLEELCCFFVLSELERVQVQAPDLAELFCVECSSCSVLYMQEHSSCCWCANCGQCVGSVSSADHCECFSLGVKQRVRDSSSYLLPVSRDLLESRCVHAAGVCFCAELLTAGRDCFCLNRISSLLSEFGPSLKFSGAGAVPLCSDSM